MLDPPIAFNVSHDGAVVALAFCPAPAPAHGVGVDVMRVRLPPRETLDAFIAVFTEQARAPPRPTSLRHSDRG